MTTRQPRRIQTISDYHRFRELPKPEHPLISVLNLAAIDHLQEDEPLRLVADFYLIVLKLHSNAKLKYGQQAYDFDEGVLLFLAPGQVFSIEAADALDHAGWLLLVHPDFLWHTPLATRIKHYDYFKYTVHEALHLSAKEEAMVTGVMQHIAQEYHANVDAFSQPVIVAQLDLLLTYADRFYHRQFLTRKIANHAVLTRLENLLAAYFAGDQVATSGLPTVQAIADALHVSPSYLGSLLKVLTGQSTQQHIHDKLIEKAKEKLANTTLSVSEIAYQLGFEHPQSFNKLFKTKTARSPLEFRQSFN